MNYPHNFPKQVSIGPLIHTLIIEKLTQEVFTFYEKSSLYMAIFTPYPVSLSGKMDECGVKRYFYQRGIKTSADG